MLDKYTGKIVVDTLTGWSVVDSQTGSVVKSYPKQSRLKAVNYSNKLDLQYGAVRYCVAAVHNKGE